MGKNNVGLLVKTSKSTYDKGENYELINHEVPQHLYRGYIITLIFIIVKQI